MTTTHKTKTITADRLEFNSKTGVNEGYRNVVYTDVKNKNMLTGNYCYYNDKTGVALATRNPTAIDFSQKDTLWMHADTFRLKTYHINTDSVYRKVFGYKHVRVFRNDVQAVCDSMVMNSKDSCLTMYKDPIVWSGENRQLLGEEIRVYMRDSTIDWAHVVGQALSVEQLPDKKHFNQIASKEMKSFFIDGKMKKNEAISNVMTIYYPVDDKDSTLIGLNYAESDTMRMYLDNNQRLEKIWMPKANLVMYPMTQIPPGRDKLNNFAWFDYIRPVDKNDIYEWRGKKSGTELKVVKRHEAPLQKLGINAPLSSEGQKRQKGAEP